MYTRHVQTELWWTYVSVAEAGFAKQSNMCTAAPDGITYVHLPSAAALATRIAHSCALNDTARSCSWLNLLGGLPGRQLPCISGLRARGHHGAGAKERYGRPLPQTFEVLAPLLEMPSSLEVLGTLLRTEALRACRPAPGSEASCPQ